MNVNEELSHRICAEGTPGFNRVVNRRKFDGTGIQYYCEVCDDPEHNEICVVCKGVGKVEISIPSLQQASLSIRKRILTMCAKAGTGRLGSSLSCVEILTALYHGGILRFDPAHPGWEERDRFILSKGHTAPALYAVLADLGYFPADELDRMAQVGGKLGILASHNVPGVEATTGSLGQGFGIAVGMAMAAKIDRTGHRVYCLLGDGECQEGSIWEAAMFAAHHQLSNLVAIIDRNQLSVMGRTEEIVKLDPLEAKWRAFGWEAWGAIDGHNPKWILDTLLMAREASGDGKPKVLIANTTKGKGIPAIEGQPGMHYDVPRGEEETAQWMEALERGWRP